MKKKTKNLAHRELLRLHTEADWVCNCHLQGTCGARRRNRAIMPRRPTLLFLSEKQDAIALLHPMWHLRETSRSSLRLPSI
jgi:hypothetical protein